MATNNLYTTKTASLKATKADISKLDAKKLLLNGKNILDYISDSEFNSYDTRDPQLKNDELDIWNTTISLSEEGHIEVKPFEHDYNSIRSTHYDNIESTYNVIANELLGYNDSHLMYWQTDGLTDGNRIFSCSRLLTTFNSDLSSMSHGEYMFSYCKNLTSFNSNLPNLIDGEYMFSNCPSLTSFTSDLPNLTDGTNMFYYCDNLKSFSSDSSGSPVNLSNLTDGDGMFANCNNLTSFTSDLPNLIDGTYMFSNCPFTSFNSDLSSLTDGYGMFNCCNNLKSFSSDLPSLTNCEYMFSYCSSLTSFTSDLSSLVYGKSMFEGCDNLTSFTSDLSSLLDGEYMFSNCKLDSQSVANIIHFIPQRDATIHIGIGITNTDAAKQAFAEECDCDTWEELNKEFDDKNWGVYWQFNGEATTFDLRGERPSTAVYTKLEEVFLPTEEEIAAAKEKGEHIQIPHYQYTSQDGDNYYNIHWYHDSNTNNEGYDYFESLEMATLAYSVIPKD